MGVFKGIAGKKSKVRRRENGLPRREREPPGTIAGSRLQVRLKMPTCCV
jgi:hypothetical protein